MTHDHHGGPGRPSRRQVLGFGLGAATAMALPALLPETASAQTRPAVLPPVGTWSVTLDPDNQGLTQSWFSGPLPGSAIIQLPGDTDMAGLGNPPGPQWTAVPSDIDPAIAGQPLFRLSRPVEYTGPVWYSRLFEVPKSWSGLDIELFLERCLWQTQVWVDGTYADSQDSLSVPHVHELGVLTPGQHRLTIRIDNSDIHHSAVTVVSAHAYGNDTQTIWNGAVGLIQLRARENVRITSAQVYPDATAGTLSVVTTITNTTASQASAVLIFEPGSKGTPLRKQSVQISAAPGTSSVTTTLPLTGHYSLWDEFTPTVYHLKTTLGHGSSSETRTVPFGVRDFRADGTQFTLNGRTIMLRGTHDGGAFPVTGWAPMDVPPWRDVFKALTAHGLNHYRCHSWCPPDAAFTAADEAGVLIHVELPAAFEDVSPAANADRSAFIAAELDRILATYGNHPSFCLLSMGNELNGNSRSVTSPWVAHARAADPRHFYTIQSNPEALGAYLPDPEDQYMVAHAAKVNGQRVVRRMEIYADPDKPSTAPDYAYTLAGINIPVLSHEVGQWSVYPDYREIPEYTGVLKPRNFEAFRSSLNGHGMLGQAGDFTAASGHASLRIYKEEVERALRSAGFGGFQLLDLHDYPGQGTALVGMLNVFWKSKGIITDAAWRRFCGPVVPLLRLDSLQWQTSQTITGTVQVANYGKGDVTGTPRWTVRDSGGKAVASGSLPATTYQQGGLRDAGSFTLPLSGLAAPERYNIEVELPGTGFANDWNIWVYPASVSAGPASSVTVTTDLNTTLTALAAGQRVVFLAAGQLNPPAAEPVNSTTPFWDTLLFPTEAKTMGILCDPDHPALAGFPTDSYADWQWWELLTGNLHGSVSRLDATAAGYRPIVQAIHHAPENRKLGAVYEFQVGSGKLLVATLDVSGNLAGRPVAAQLRRSLLDYAASDAFAPATAADETLLRSLFFAGSVAGLSGPYRVVNSGSGLVMDTSGEGTANGALLVQSVDTGSGTQHWQFTPTGDGYYRLTNVASGTVLDVTGNSSAPGTQLDIWPVNGGLNQEWLVQQSGAGYTLTARNSGLNADVSQGSAAAGAPIVQSVPSSAASQVWKLLT